MKKLISYCLYGSNNKYIYGILESIISAKLFMIGWDIRVYVSTGKQCVPKWIIPILKNLNCEIIEFNEINNDETKKNREDIEGMYQRFRPLFEENVDYWISRDADSRFTKREYKMIEEWIQSNKTIHAILDHPCHHNIMGGLFGINNNLLKEKYSNKKIDIYNDYLKPTCIKNVLFRGSDQIWITNYLKDIIINKDILIHLNSNQNCLNRCSMIGIYPIQENFDTILTHDDDLFCGKQINMFDCNNLKIQVKNLQNN